MSKVSKPNAPFEIVERAIPEPSAGSLEVPPLQLLGGRQSVKGSYSGTSIDSQDMLEFSALSGVRSINEVFPLEQVSQAYERMLSGKARFRVVLTTGN